MPSISTTLRTARTFSRSTTKTYFNLSRSFSSSLRRNEINKVYPSAEAAIADMASDSTLLCGGFGLSGVPDTLIHQVKNTPNITGLTAVSNNAGVVGGGLGLLLESKQVKKMIASYVGENKPKDVEQVVQASQHSTHPQHSVPLFRPAS